MRPRFVPLISAALLVMIIGCASPPAATLTGGGEAQKAVDLLVIDCLLPGQVRKLGQNMTYLAPRRPIKTTAADCEIRGGEYVAYDRANYATALKIWLPAAQAGDPEAQTYVGEIYEKGLGLEADYALAAAWYRKAAEQGNSRAQINLGFLYESGLGVERDLVTAMNWYRKASGLADGDIEFVSSVEVARREAAQRETAELKQEVGQLNAELEQARRQLSQRKARLEDAEQHLSSLKQQLESARLAAASPATTAPPANTAEPAASERELEQRLSAALNERQRLIAKLADEQLESDALSQQLQRAERQLADRRQELQTIQQQLAQTRADLDREIQQRALQRNSTKISEMQSRIDHLETVISAKKTAIATLESEREAQHRNLEQKLESTSGRELELRQELDARNREVVALRMGLSQRSEVIASLEATLQQSEQAQQRLAARLHEQEQDANQLRGNLDAAARDLASRQDALNATEQELTRARQDLQQYKAQKSAESKETIAKLENRILILEKTQRDRQQALAAMERESSEQQVRLTSKLAQAELSERALRKNLTASKQEVAALQAQLEIAETQLAQTAQSDGKIAELEQELARREQEIARQKEEIGRIEAKLGQPGDKGDTVEFASLVTARSVGPTIEIIEPPIAVMRGKPSVPLHSEISTLEIIGRVSPADELISFRINDEPRETDASGLFQVAVEVSKPDTPVHAVAVDKDGRRATLDFVILPESRPTSTAAVAEADERSHDSETMGLAFGDYHALIIGNDNYAHMTNLRTAGNDARTVARLLKDKYGFKTQLLLDADRYTMLSALNKLMRELTEEDNLLIYYAGHGELDNVNLRGYWLPVDAEQEDTTNWISNVTVTDMLNVMSAKHVLVVADSCYSGALTRSSLPRLQGGMSDKARADWYKAMNHVRARAALTSGGVRPVLDSGGGEHSIFAQAFIEVLEQNDGILEGYRLYREVQTRVKTRAATLRMEQDPQYAPIKYAGHEAGEFFFRPAGSASSDYWFNLPVLAAGGSAQIERPFGSRLPIRLF